MCAGDGLALCVSPSKDGIAGCGVSEGYETRAPIHASLFCFEPLPEGD